MKKKDFMIILAVLLLAAGLFAYSQLNANTGAKQNASQGLDGAIVTFEASHIDPVTWSNAAYAEEPAATPAPEPNSYMCIWLGNQFQLFPLVTEGNLSIKQSDTVENVVHVIVDGFYMHSSTCANQDCVKQGEVTLDNIETRILANWVVCLPNNVMLELLTPEQAEELVKASQLLPEYADEGA